MSKKLTSKPTSMVPPVSSLAVHLGPVVGAHLEALPASFDAGLRGSPSALKALLAKRKYPAHPPVLAFEERYGGLLVPDAPGQAGFDWLFGTYGCLSGGGHVEPRGGGPTRGPAALVPVCFSPNDNIWYLDGHGAAFAEDTIGGSGVAPFARDGDCLVARLLVFNLANLLRVKGQVRLAGAHGAALAKKLALPAIPQATDPLSSAWGTREVLAIEYRQPPGQVQTVVWGGAAATVKAACKGLPVVAA